MQLELLDTFDIPTVNVPPRSRLISLDPQGIGSTRAEGLISYFTRLAGIHVVRPNLLFAEVVLPLTEIRLPNYSSNFNAEYARTLNSYTKYAKEASSALRRLTHQPGIEYLNLIPWGDLFDPKGSCVLRDHVGICPECLDLMGPENSKVYYPLLWYLRPVRICSIHQRILREDCPSCGMYQRFVSSHAMLGYCTQCGAWLGNAPDKTPSAEDSVAITTRDRYMTAALEEMILHNPTVRDMATHERFVDRLSYYAQLLTQGNLRALERQLGFSKNVFVSWADKRKRPRLDLFLELCMRLKATPIRFLTEEVSDGWTHSIGRFERKPAVSRPDKNGKTMTAFRARLQEILDGPDAPTQLDVAQKLGLKRPFLIYHFPELARAISIKHQQHRSNVAEAKRNSRVNKAKAVATAMMEMTQPISNRRLSRALRSEGLVLADPDVREAVGRVVTTRNAKGPG